MFRRYRHRRGPYAMAAPSQSPRILRKVIFYAVLLLLLYLAGKWVIGLFGGGNAIQSRTVLMTVEGGGRVNVSFDGGLMQPAADTVKLHPGDRVATGTSGLASLEFFDGSRMRLDAQSELMIDESEQGSESSSMELELTKGSLWVRTPETSAFSGSIVRTITTPLFGLTLPSDTETVIEQSGIMVFSADDAGVAMDIRDAEETVYIGEGQQILLPKGGEIAGNVLRFRSAIDPLAIHRDFIENARLATGRAVRTGSGAMQDDDMLVVQSPQDNATITASTVRVDGSVGLRVDRVRVNGYLASIDRERGTFGQELAMRAGDESMSIHVEALDARGLVLAEVNRSVKRGDNPAGQTAANQPAITLPAKAGETYRTQKTEFEIRGTAPAGTEGIMVNEYKLQLFRPGDTTWSYLASTALNNLKEGTNFFDVYALDAQGNKGTPVRLTVLLGQGSEGVIATGSSSATSSAAPQLDESQLPKNDPLMPGTLSVTGPTAGSQHTATGSEFLLMGTTPRETSSVWVNGYKLQLYGPGKTYWNYIAKVEYQTLKRGTNTYRIVARNAENQILDTFTYTVEYNP